MFAKLQLASLLVLLVGAAAVKEPASGLDFAPKTKLGALSGLGIRKKGPIKVYAVGKYDQGFELRMVMGVGAEKMTNSLKDALKPRCGDLGALDGFSDVIHHPPKTGWWWWLRKAALSTHDARHEIIRAHDVVAPRCPHLTRHDALPSATVRRPSFFAPSAR